MRRACRLFTGIVESTGRLLRSREGSIEIECEIDGLAVGESIAVSGACLTVRSLGARSFIADISEETARRTNLGALAPGEVVNLERPLLATGRLGGHIVQGHVDGTGRVVAVEQLDGSVEISIEVPGSLARYLVEKGSVAVDGVSLTVALVSGDNFRVALVPNTLEVTTLGSRKPGDTVNIEVDILAKYIERLTELGTPKPV